MSEFQLVTRFQPAGDQPEAIRQMVEGLEAGLSHQTLLGVTGSGKTFSIANVIAQVQRPTLVLAPNKTLAAQLYGEFKSFFPNNAVEYFVSYYDYYQPEAYVPSSDTFIEKDASINDHIEQMRRAQQSRHQALTDWGFTFTLHTASTSNSDSDIDADAYPTPTTTLQLHTVPVIANERLHASDLLEYIHFITTHPLPTSLLVPPVVQRVVSSRACHRAVKFGDVLSTSKCVELCNRLMCTELPFQCAHGRPSMVPLLDMRSLFAHKRQELVRERFEMLNNL